MSNRVKQRLPERRFRTLGAMQNRPDYTPPFSYSTTEYNYAATDCGFAHRRHRSTTVLGGMPYYGMRFYNPDLGRWVSRDPIGERGGVNLFAGFQNNSISQLDYIGLFLADSDCKKGKDEFMKLNPKWKKLINDAAAGGDETPKCLLHWNFSCNCRDGLGGLHYFGGGAGKNKIGMITLCCNNQADTSDLFETMAHELTHFLDFCGSGVDYTCEKEPLSSKERYTCFCAEKLCKELRAHMQAGQCSDSSSCWKKLKKKGYLDRGFCKMAKDKGAKEKEFIKKLKDKGCKKPSYPIVIYPASP